MISSGISPEFCQRFSQFFFWNFFGNFSRDSFIDYSRDSYRIFPEISPGLPSGITFIDSCRDFFIDLSQVYFRDSFRVLFRDSFKDSFRASFRNFFRNLLWDSFTGFPGIPFLPGIPDSFVEYSIDFIKDFYEFPPGISSRIFYRLIFNNFSSEF